MDIERFDDGTSVEWFSREALVYRDQDYIAQVEYDYFKISAFKTGRTIFPALINSWEAHPAGSPSIINEETKQKIIDKVVRYFEKRNFPVEIDER